MALVRDGLFIVLVASTLSGYGLCEPQLCEGVGALRLTPTPSIASPDGNVGRLEVCNGDTWGTYTLDFEFLFWPEKNIQVACRQLGFSTGLNSIPPSHIPLLERTPADLSVHFDTVVCFGAEERLTSCASNMVSNRNASRTAHLKDVFLVCQPNLIAYSDLHIPGEQLGDVRLFGDVNNVGVLTNGVGAVEILTDQFGWTGICPDGWDGRDARIVCQSLGYDIGTAQTYRVNDVSVNRSVGNAVCSDNLRDVPPSPIQAGLCSFQEASSCSEPSGVYAGVYCDNRQSSVQDQVRLFGRGLFHSTRAVGVVEVFLDKRWGVVCDNQPQELALVNARVLCRRFFNGKIGDAKLVQISAASLRMYESHQKPIWANGLICPSNTTDYDFNECMFDEPLGFANCSSGHVLAVDCGSTDTKRENNETTIIVAVGLIVFLFVLVFFVFGTVMYRMLVKKRTTTIGTGSFALTGGDLGNNGGRSAGINVYAEEEEDTKEGGGATNPSASNLDLYQTEEKFTKA